MPWVRRGLLLAVHMRGVGRAGLCGECPKVAPDLRPTLGSSDAELTAPPPGLLAGWLPCGPRRGDRP